MTAAFNRNLLARINRELGADFVPDQFIHLAFYNAAQGAYRDPPREPRRTVWSASAASASSSRPGESILHRELCTSTALPDLPRGLARAGGFEPEFVWTDDAQFFSVSYLTVV